MKETVSILIHNTRVLKPFCPVLYMTFTKLRIFEYRPILNGFAIIFMANIIFNGFLGLTLTLLTSF